MTIDSTDKNDGNSFEYRLKEVSDEEIISIIRFREYYQPHAVKAAIKEALRREIISSIDDLEKDEFKPRQLPSKSLFPISYNESQNLTLFRSLSRILFFFGAIPVLYGIFLCIEKQFFIAIISFLIGFTVIFVATKLRKSMKPIFAQLLLSFNVPAVLYALFLLSTEENLSKMNIATTFLIIITLLYTSIYLYKLTNYLNK